MASIDLPVPGSDFNTWGEKLNIVVNTVNDQGDPANVRNIVSTDIDTVGSDIEGVLSAKIVTTAPSAPPLVSQAATLAAEVDGRPCAYLDGYWWGYGASTIVYRSADGVTWTSYGTLPSGQVQQIISTDGDSAVIVTDLAIYKSANFFAGPAPTFSTAKVTANGAARHTRFGVSSGQGGTFSQLGQKIIVAQYGPGNPTFADSRYAYKSVDYGETWSLAWDSDTDTTNVPGVSHVHGCEYDPWEDRWYVIEGHSTDAGVWTSATGEPGSWSLHNGYRMYSAPTCCVATDDGLFMSSDDGKAGTLGIPRVGAVADRAIIRTWAWRTGFGSDVLGFGTQAVRDPNTGVVYASYQSSFAGQSPIIAGGTATTGGLVYAYPDAASVFVGDEINAIAHNPTTGVIKAPAFIGGTRKIITTYLTRRGSTTTDRGGLLGGYAGRGTGVSVGPGSSAGDFARGTAVGSNSRAQQDSVALGFGAIADAAGVVAIGYQAATGAAGNTVIGRGASSPSLTLGSNVLVGDATSASAASATGIGAGATVAGSFGVALGRLAQVNQNGGVAIGHQANVGSGHTNSVALGKDTATSRGSQVQVGGKAIARAAMTEPAAPPAGEVFDYAVTVGGITKWVMQFAGGRKVPVAGSLGTGQDPVFTTAARPSAVSVGAGSRYYDSTLSKPAWSDGTTWRDAMGTAV